MAELESAPVDYTVHEAARLCGRSVDTIRRHRRDGRFPNACQQGGEPNAPWRIPLADLVAAGIYQPATTNDVPSTPRSPPTHEPADPGHQVDSRRLSDALDQIAWLRGQNQELLAVIEHLTRTVPSPARHLQSLDERATA